MDARSRFGGGLFQAKICRKCIALFGLTERASRVGWSGAVFARAVLVIFRLFRSCPIRQPCPFGQGTGGAGPAEISVQPPDLRGGGCGCGSPSRCGHFLCMRHGIDADPALLTARPHGSRRRCRFRRKDVRFRWPQRHRRQRCHSEIPTILSFFQWLMSFSRWLPKTCRHGVDFPGITLYTSPQINGVLRKTP